MEVCPCDVTCTFGKRETYRPPHETSNRESTKTKQCKNYKRRVRDRFASSLFIVVGLTFFADCATHNRSIQNQRHNVVHKSRVYNLSIALAVAPILPSLPPPSSFTKGATSKNPELINNRKSRAKIPLAKFSMTDLA